MVGATSIGELAWSVENLLNRVIDQTLKLNDDTFALIDEVNARIPSLIQEFRRGDYTGDVDGLISRAEALATTRRTETGTAETEVAEATETVTEARPRPQFWNPKRNRNWLSRRAPAKQRRMPTT